MILVDSSVWIDHLRRGDRRLEELLDSGLVLGHPWVIGELALGRLSEDILELVGNLPSAPVADADELLEFVTRHSLMGRGIGYVDVQLLASARLAAVSLWTRDRRLVEAATLVGCGFPIDG